MQFHRRTLVGGALAGSLAACAASPEPVAAIDPPPPAFPDDPQETIELWPEGPPGAPDPLPVETVTERSQDPLIRDRALSGIARPRMVVFRAAHPGGAALLVMPGGGYQRVVMDKEGFELGRWLAARGVTAYVLFYRLPGDGWAAGPDVALQDTQRAMRLLRRHAQGLGVDPVRIGALGYSAGGHACADLAARFAQVVYRQVDDADRLSARPLLAAPVYPVISMSAPAAHAGSRERLLGPAPSPAQQRAHSPHLNVPADAPPHFLLHAEDDAAVPVENTLLLRAALQAMGIPVETHLFAQGGHGFGLRDTAGLPVAAWPELFLAWARRVGLS